MRMYGVLSITHHGWSKVLTVMCDRGRGAALACIQPGDGIEVRAEAGRLTQYYGQTTGHLERLADRHGIIMLSRADWNAKKDELRIVILD